MDEVIRELQRRLAGSPGEINLLIMLILALLRAGRAAEAAALLLANLELLGEEAFTLVRQYPALADALRAILPTPTPTSPLARFRLWHLLKQLLQFSGSGVAEAAGVVLSGPLAILGGLLIAVPKRATLGWDWGGWWRDPCAKLLAEINDAFADETQTHSAFEGSPSRGGAMQGLTNAGHVMNLCARYRRDCPQHDGSALVAAVQQTEESRRDQYLDYLATR